MNTFPGLRVHKTRHFLKQAEEKGVKQADVDAVLSFPGTKYESRNHPGQYRLTGRGICLVVKPEPNTGRLVVITVYVNTTETPRRPDQK